MKAHKHLKYEDQLGKIKKSDVQGSDDSLLDCARLGAYKNLQLILVSWTRSRCRSWCRSSSQASSPSPSPSSSGRRFGGGSASAGASTPPAASFLLLIGPPTPQLSRLPGLRAKFFRRPSMVSPAGLPLLHGGHIRGVRAVLGLQAADKEAELGERCDVRRGTRRLRVDTAGRAERSHHRHHLHPLPVDDTARTALSHSCAPRVCPISRPLREADCHSHTHRALGDCAPVRHPQEVYLPMAGRRPPLRAEFLGAGRVEVRHPVVRTRRHSVRRHPITICKTRASRQGPLRQDDAGSSKTRYQPLRIEGDPGAVTITRFWGHRPWRGFSSSLCMASVPSLALLRLLQAEVGSAAYLAVVEGYGPLATDELGLGNYHAVVTTTIE